LRWRGLCFLGDGNKGSRGSAANGRDVLRNVPI
jgi:hypothetical protein